MPAPLSKAASLASLEPSFRAKILAELSDAQTEELLHDWEFWARPEQLAPQGEWSAWLVMAGRGFGKTRTGAEWIRQKKNTCGRIALVAPTASDARDVMVEGESGILAISPANDRPVYEPSKRRLTWANGAIATTYSADEPERLRGPQSDAAWCDEIAAWRYIEAWDMLQFGLRLGTHPQVVATTTPRPVKIVRDLLYNPSTIVTRGSTYDNAANLAPSFLTSIVKRYEGTRLGRQELNAEMLEDTPGALWKRELIDKLRVVAAPIMRRIVVAIDPAVSNLEGSDESGIVVAGVDEDGHGNLLEDLSGRYAPNEWAQIAIAAYRRWKADLIIGEVNNGGDMIEATLRGTAPNVSYKAVHASKGKFTRAEPISALYEQGRVHHVGTFGQLEDQMCSFTSDFDRKAMGYSPDRMDAAVWAFTELMTGPSEMGMLEFYRTQYGPNRQNTAAAGR